MSNILTCICLIELAMNFKDNINNTIIIQSSQ